MTEIEKEILDELTRLMDEKGLPGDIITISTNITSAALILLKAAIHLSYSSYPVDPQLLGAAVARLLAVNPNLTDEFCIGFESAGVGREVSIKIIMR